MILSRIWNRSNAPSAALPAVPDGMRVYAIGDIHGCDDLFAELVSRIERDHAERGDDARPVLILLGDLVDRGPQSRSVVERAMALGESWPDVRLLLGNHEEVFLEALRGDPRMVRYFVRIGGGPTINSYGIDGERYAAMDFDELAAALPGVVPASHVAFLSAGQDQVVLGDYLFVHAGIRPGLALTAQAPSDLRWIRDEFLRDRRDHGLMVVHGHTITETVDEQPNRIGIDTGAYASGVLTAIALEGTERWFLATGSVN